MGRLLLLLIDGRSSGGAARLCACGAAVAIAFGSCGCGGHTTARAARPSTSSLSALTVARSLAFRLDRATLLGVTLEPRAGRAWLRFDVRETDVPANARALWEACLVARDAASATPNANLGGFAVTIHGPRGSVTRVDRRFGLRRGDGARTVPLRFVVARLRRSPDVGTFSVRRVDIGAGVAVIDAELAHPRRYLRLLNAVVELGGLVKEGVFATFSTPDGRVAIRVGSSTRQECVYGWTDPELLKRY